MDKIIARNTEIDSRVDPLEAQANIFSRSVLAPACVLNALNVKTIDDIVRLCNISKKSSEIRLNRLNDLRKRSAFLKSPLEREVFNNFKDYIQENRV